MNFTRPPSHDNKRQGLAVGLSGPNHDNGPKAWGGGGDAIFYLYLFYNK